MLMPCGQPIATNLARVTFHVRSLNGVWSIPNVGDIELGLSANEADLVF
jgi:hypothetical protein